ncbi:MAG: hypothetical protein E7318_03735 [Clostridiales bacterium]|nr:hypothetical protein [Clostridiales bacterium]
MILFITDVIGYIINIIKLVLGLVWSLIEGFFGLLGGVFSFVLWIIGFLLALALVMLAIHRRAAYKQRQQAQAESSQRVYDVDEEEFTSFYDQYRTKPQE